MASQIGLQFQDQNFGVQHKGASVVGKMNPVKSQKKIGARKPLGEISNSTNIAAPSQGSKKNSAFFKEATAMKTHEESLKKSTLSKQTRTRNPLSDISNSGKSHLHEPSKNKRTLKLSAVEEEHLFPSCIADEQFLHDHRKCIKAQNSPMDVEEFLAIVGLVNASSMQIESPVPLKLSKMKPENHGPCVMELEEMSENEYLWEQKLNSPICRTPKSPTDRSAFWENYDRFDFELTMTP